MLNIKYDLKTINKKREQIKNKIYEQSQNIKTDDFTKISDNDLYILYNLYDELFLDSWFKYNFKGKIIFKMSRQLSRAAGNTKTKKNIGLLKPEDIEFEIKISVNHLVNFDKIDRSKSVGGIEVKNKLDSLLLVFEHELCHVIEFLICKKSDCNKQNFKNLIYNLFGQIETTHKLVSVREANYKEYGLLPGDKVTFNDDGVEFNGIITKINKHATVMSPTLHGKYVDKTGQHYTKYYIPLSCLLKC